MAVTQCPRQIDNGTDTVVAGANIAEHLCVKEVSGVLQLAGSTDEDLGTALRYTASGYECPIRLANHPGVALFIAVDAIAAGDPFYAAANGKVSASGTVKRGIARSTTTADGDILAGQRSGNAAGAADAGGTTAAAFEVNSDSTTPKLAVGSQAGGTGDFTTTLKPEATLSGDNAIIVPEADGDVLAALALAQTLTNKTLGDGTKDTRAAQTVNPAADNGAGSQILAGVTQVNVGAVVNDANDWVNLPAIASVGIGHTIRIACNAGGNFELRTPAASNTKINDVDSDGTQEYLCTDTDVVIVTKATTTGWVAQSLTKLGAVRTAVIPD